MRLHLASARRGLGDEVERVSIGLRRLCRPVADFAETHSVPWELGMAVLAIAFVLAGFGAESVGGRVGETLGAVEGLLTLVFVLEFTVRFLGSWKRMRYLRDHFLDLVALLPLARGLRVARLVRLLRLVRSFTGVRRVFLDVDRLSAHHGLGTLVIAWLGTMFLSSTVFYAVESDVNPGLQRPEDALWWGLATLTGGATTIAATTDEGRIATAALLIIGVALFTAITASVVSYFVTTDRSRGRVGGGVAARLREITTLRDERLITDDEFLDRRSAILAEL